MAFTDRVEFTKEMKKEGYTILAPNMAPIHFRLFENLFASYGYNVEILQTRGRQIVDEGLKYVHNDTCYPALLVIGQFIDALNSGKYDLDHTALLITQTGGGCRASNYIKLLRKERGITQKQAAEDLGVSQALLSHYEKGIRECGLVFVVRVADYYNVSCDYLLGRSAERNGMMLNADDLPNPDKMKDNVYHGSVLPTMNKKLISNSLNVLYAKIAECHSKALTTEVSTYLMMAVAKMFRLLYSAEPHNAQSLFSVEARRWPGYSDAVMRMSESNVEDLLAGEDLNGAEGVKYPS